MTTTDDKAKFIAGRQKADAKREARYARLATLTLAELNLEKTVGSALTMLNDELRAEGKGGLKTVDALDAVADYLAALLAGMAAATAKPDVESITNTLKLTGEMFNIKYGEHAGKYMLLRALDGEGSLGDVIDTFVSKLAESEGVTDADVAGAARPN